jgi:hypothetical protein
VILAGVIREEVAMGVVVVEALEERLVLFRANADFRLAGFAVPVPVAVEGVVTLLAISPMLCTFACSCA